MLFVAQQLRQIWDLIKSKVYLRFGFIALMSLCLSLANGLLPAAGLAQSRNEADGQSIPFKISQATSVDTDQDGLLDDWEIRGYDANNDGTIDLDLPALGASPTRKDLFIELDWMEGCQGSASTQKPIPSAINSVVTAFANAPVTTNPDGSTGITLHVDYGQGGVFTGGNSIPCQTNIRFPEDFQSLKNSYFTASRQRIFHYNIWGFNYNSTTSSGVAELPGDDLLVALGSFQNGTGTEADQAGTFMHELGHNIGLQHGGTTDSVNYKPHHLSVMNYSFQLDGVIFGGSFGTFDYARFSPPALNERRLNESIGLNGGSGLNNYGTIWYCGGRSRQTNAVNSPIDWNCSGSTSQTAVSTDVNRDSRRATLQSSGVEWSSLILADPNRPGIPSGSSVGPFGESLPMVAQQSARQQRLDELRQQYPKGYADEAPAEELRQIQRDRQERDNRLAPSRPQNIMVELQGAAVKLTWDRPAIASIEGEAIEAYKVFRVELSGPTDPGFLPQAVELGTTSESVFVDTTAVRGKLYRYLVGTKSRNSVGSSVRTAPIQVPPAPR